MTEEEARRLVMEGVGKLVEYKLVARTWGNISARIDAEWMVITPSGRDYASLKATDLVKVRIRDLHWDGDIKPSSESGIHADCYALRPDVGYVVHTHQLWATAITLGGAEVAGSQPVPYAPSASQALRKRVRTSVTKNGQCTAFQLARHGMLFLARDMEDAFRQALETEETCKEEFSRRVDLSGSAPKALGSSVRRGDHFILSLGSHTSVHEMDEEASGEAALHRQIYLHNPKAQCIVHCHGKASVALSRLHQTVHPVIDDIAQCGGVSFPCVDLDLAATSFKDSSLIFIKDAGALAIAKDGQEALALETLTEKDASGELYARAMGTYSPLGRREAERQRRSYLESYSLLKDEA